MEYIYESPDGGKTVYRYPLGQHDKRECIKGADIPEICVTDEGVVLIKEDIQCC